MAHTWGGHTSERCTPYDCVLRLPAALRLGKALWVSQQGCLRPLSPCATHLQACASPAWSGHSCTR